MMARVFISGINGQDGSLLARFLLQRGHSVCGSTRRHVHSLNDNLEQLQIRRHVEVLQFDTADEISFEKKLRQIQPDEIYLLSGQSSVAKSFDKPGETFRSFLSPIITALDYAKNIAPHVRIFNAGSGECYGELQGARADELTKFAPRSPYGMAKVAAHSILDNYRSVHGVYCCTGILFNHESALRPEGFVSQKIVRSALRIKSGSLEQLRLGSLGVVRDWGWAADYVEAMWLMLQQPKPKDFVVATGKSHSLEFFVETVFRNLGLTWQDHVIIDQSLARPFDVLEVRANPSAIQEILGWRHTRDINAVIDGLIEGDLS